MRKLQLGQTKILIVDDLPPEDNAMLQALYSRSASSAEEHLDVIDRVGPGKFMSNYVVGYGHKSIADCGTTTLFFENVSILAAKAIQDWPLYSGQETSTRYIDMSKQRIIDPVGTVASSSVLGRWMEFYTKSQDAMADVVRKRYPRKESEKEETYEKAVKARVFDVLRGFLPAGITTQLSWHSNLRQIADHLVGITRHPSEEIRNLGLAARALLAEAYPSSGMSVELAGVTGVSNKDAEAAEARSKWNQKVADTRTYKRGIEYGESYFSIQGHCLRSFSEEELTLLAERPKGCLVPHEFAAKFQYTIQFDLDFGSFRDLQRHRNGVIRMPILSAKSMFEPWYLTELGPLEEAGRALVAAQTEDIMKLTDDPVARQYYTALGYRVPCDLHFGLPALIYIMEIRSAKTVHPTLRRRIHEVIRKFEKNSYGFALHVDMDPDDWTVRRGTQTITPRTG